MTGSHFNINVGTFVPKPHTPFQWAAQLDEESSRKKLDYIRSRLKPFGHKVGIQDPFASFLEGILSRGDERVGGLIEEAFLSGCRLDAWSEYLKKDIWRYIFSKNQGLVRESIGPKRIGGILPWEVVKSGISSFFLESEHAGSVKEKITLPCMINCTHNCGICGEKDKIVENIIHDDNLLCDAKGVSREDSVCPSGGKIFRGNKMSNNVYMIKENIMSKGAVCQEEAALSGPPQIPGCQFSEPSSPLPGSAALRENNILLSDSVYTIKKNIMPFNAVNSPGRAALSELQPPAGRKDPVTRRIIFSFTKLKGAVFLSHLSIIEIFAMAFLRAGIPASFSQGFNPLPRLEIASPAALGIFSDGEIAAVDTDEYLEAREFARKMNRQLPQGLLVMNAMNIEIRSGAKKHSLSSRLWGFAYGRDGPYDPALSGAADYIKAADDKGYRGAYASNEGSVYGLRRIAVLARPPHADGGGSDRGVSYFEAYRVLYPENQRV
jgi:hypothetical protein